MSAASVPANPAKRSCIERDCQDVPRKTRPAKPVSRTSPAGYRTEKSLAAQLVPVSFSTGWMTYTHTTSSPASVTATASRRTFHSRSIRRARTDT
jgi:hypothetical protein